MMLRIVAVMGWTVAILLGALYVTSQDDQQLADLEAQAEDTRALRASLRTTQEALEAAKAQLAKLEAGMVAEGDVDGTASGSSTVPQDFDPGKLLETMLDAEDGKADENPMSAMMKMFSGEEGAEMRKLGARMAISSTYGPMFTELQLDPETEVAVRDILMEHMSGMMDKGFGALQGLSAEEAQATFEDAEAALHAQLAEVLTPEEMDQYLAYEEEMPARMIRQQYESQLGMIAPSLDPETRTAVLDVMVEEVVQVQDPTNPNMNVSQVFEDMRGAYDRALERLGPTLDDGQYAEVEQFIQQQVEMQEMGARMMEQFMPEMMGGSQEGEE